MWLAIGRIRGTHGLRGDVKVESYSGEYDHFDRLETVHLRKGDREREVVVESWKRSGGKAVVSFYGVDTPEAASRLRDWELWAPREQAAPLGDGEYYVADLIGLAVYHGDEELGTVSAVYDGGQGSLLEVSLPGGTSLVPFLEVYVGTVDLEQRRLELRVRWILE